MKKLFVIINLFFFLTLNLFSQTFDGEWSADYVIPDDQFSFNSPGQRVMSVGAFEANSFVALVRRSSSSSYYLVGYRDASHESGRLGNYPYAPSNYKTAWNHLFDADSLHEAKDLATKDSLIYVANNFEIFGKHNILVFVIKEDSIYTFPKRFETGPDKNLWAIDIDNSNNVFVTTGGDSSTSGSVLIYNSDSWDAGGKSGSLLHEITDIPDNGSLRGITVNDDGTILYVSNWLNNKVYCYTGNPTDGYSLFSGFNFEVDSTFDYTIGTVTGTADVGPWGLQYMDTKNILMVTHDTEFGDDGRYGYGRIYFANPNTGEVLDTLNVAEWNFAQAGQYDNPDTLGTASGYTSVFNVDYDNEFNLYSQTYYGWTVDKWQYSSELPTIEITITNVEIINNTVPERFTLQQNYPNPFNPTTTIEFSITESSDVTLSIYSITGELVTKLIDGENYNSGTYKISLDASLLTSGTYFYSLRNGNKTISKKMTLLK